MSTTIDQRVVSLQFDNKQFERNTATTMSTLDKLKEKLTFSGASKGLENVGTAAKNVNLNGLGSGVEAVTAKFSALQVMGITALANITNSAVNAGKRMVRSLTVEPVGGGFKEYEMMLNAVQTTMAGTGKTAEEVQQELKKLDEYADKTVYSTADMLNNLPKFTNAGVALEDATQAMIGIANATALAGGDAGKASIAFYNLGQAIGTGYLTRMDYNSINNAGIATMEWKEQMVEAAVAAGTLTKKADGTYQAGKKTFTLQQLFIDGLQEQWATTEVMMKVFGDYGDEQTEIGKKAYSAAQDIKTFTMMMESLKATAETGWKDTWQLLFGDLDEAKEFWTSLTNTISGVITRIADWRNRILQVALDFSAPWKAITEKIGKVSDVVSKVTGTLEYFQDVVDKVWLGKFNNWGDNPDRRDLLKKAGYDPKVVQYLVNLGEEAHKAGKTYKLTAEDVAKAHEKYGKTVKLTAEETEDAVDAYNNLSDAQLKKAKLTEDEIRLYRALEEEAGKAGKTVGELAKEMSETDGREMLINSFKNVGKTIAEIFGSLKKAIGEVFDIPSAEVLGVRLYGLLRTFNEFTKKVLDFTKNNSEKLTNAFKGIAAIAKVVGLIFGGPLSLAFKVAWEVINELHFGITDIALSVSDAIVKFSDWLIGIIDIDAAVEFLVPIIVDAVKAVGEWLKQLKESEAVQSFFTKTAELLKNTFKALGPIIKAVANVVGTLFSALAKSGIVQGLLSVLGELFEWIGPKIQQFAEFIERMFEAFKNSQGFQSFVDKLSSAKTGISEWFASFKDGERLPGDIISGLAKGLVKAIPLAVSAMLDVLRALIQAIRDEWDWHSPPGTFVQLGKDIITGICKGLLEIAGSLWDTAKSIFAKLPEFIKEIKFGDIAAVGLAGGVLVAVFKIIKIVEQFSKPFASFAEIGETFKEAIENISGAIEKKIKADALKARSQALLNVAIAIGILAASIALLTLLDVGKMWGAVGVIAVLAGILVGLTFALDKFSKIETSKIVKQILYLISISFAIMLLAGAMKTLSAIESDKIPGILAMFAGIIVGLVGMVALLGLLTKSNLMGNITNAGKALILMAAALLIMIFVIKIASRLDGDTVVKAVGVIAAVGALFVGMIAASKLAGANGAKAGAMLLLMSVAFGIMVGVVAIAARIPRDDVIKGIGIMAAVGALFVGMIAASKLAGQNGAKCGAMLLLMSVAFGIMVGVIAIVSKIPDKDVWRGLGVVAALGAIFTALIAVSNLAGKHALQCGLMLLLMSAAMIILSGVLFVISKMDPSGLARALGIIVVLETLFAGLIAITYFAKDCMKTLIVITAAIALLSIALIAMTFIDPKKLGVATGALSAVLAVFALLVYVTQYLDKVNPKKILGPMATLIVVVGLLALILTLMSNNIKSPEKATSAAIALSVMLTVMVGVLALLSVISKIGSKDALKGIGLLSLLVIPLAGFALVLAGMSNINNALGSVKALLLVVGAMTLLLFPLALIGMIAAPALYGIGVMVVLIAALTAMTIGLGALGQVEGVQAFVDTGIAILIQLATGIGDMIAAFTTSVSAAGLLEVLGVFLMMPFLVAGIALLLPLMLTIGVVAAAIGYALASIEGLQGFLDTGMPVLLNLANGIAQMIAAFTTTVSAAGLLETLAVFLMVPLLTYGLATLLPLMLTIGVLAAAIGGLLSYFPQLEQFIDVGIPILVKMASGLGEMIGAFVGGIMTEIASTLPHLGTMLGEFMTNAKPFIDGAKTVDEKVLAGVGILAGAIIALTAADLITGVASFLQGGSSFADLGTQLSMFMMAAMPFILGASMISEDMLSGVKMLADTILVLTAANVIEGLTSWLTGGSSLENFATQLPILGQGLAGFSDSLGAFTEEQLITVKCAANAVKTLATAASEIPNTGGLLASIVGENDLGVFAGQFPFLGRGLRGFLDNVGEFTEEQVATVNCAAQAIKTLAQASSEIPNTGGLLGMIVGENDLGTFAEQFPVLGTGLRGFLDNVGTFTEDQVATVDCAADAIKALAEASSEIPNTGGLLGMIVGENDLGTFAEQFPVLGTGIAGFLTNIGTFTEDQVATVNCAANAIKSLASASSEIPNEGGWISKIVGDNSLGTFASNFPSLGEGIKGFVDKLGTFSSEKVATVYAGVSAVRALTGLAEVDLEGAKKNISGFGKKLPDFAENLSLFCTSMPSSDSVTTAVNNIDKLLDATKKIGDANSGVLKDFAKNLKKVGEDAVKKFVGAFTSESAKTDLKSAATSLASEAPDGADDKKGAMMIAGNDLGNGLVNGIDAKQDSVYWAGYALGQKAVQGEKDGQQSKSPSKLTIKAGKWLGEGLVIGIDKMGRAVYNSGYALGESAVKSTSSAISRIADAINTDIDSQPTIRPIMDLSDVRAGANAIGNLLDTESSIGVVANAGRIGGMMNRYSQNRGNDDVVSELSKLRSEIGNMGNTSYNINGITYDDGGNVRTAVETLVRAARIERRT